MNLFSKLLDVNIIQLMHSFEVDIRICQPENSDVHRGEAEGHRQNSADPDQTPQNAASDQGLHCLLA